MVVINCGLGIYYLYKQNVYHAYVSYHKNLSSPPQSENPIDLQQPIEQVNKKKKKKKTKQIHTQEFIKPAPEVVTVVKPNEIEEQPRKEKVKVKKKQKADASGWTQRQQVDFEKALKLTPKVCPDRWAFVSSKVKGKSAKECMKRFQEIKARIIASKQKQS